MSNRCFVLVSIVLTLMTAACTTTIAPISTTPSALNRPGAPGFSTPEDAITHYFAAIVQADADAILQTCAIDEMADGFQFSRAVERTGLLLPQESLAPANDALYGAINRAQRSAEILNRVKIFAYSLLSGDTLAEGGMMPMDAAQAKSFIEKTDSARLAQIELMQIGAPEAAFMNSERYRENAAELAALYGADELTERVALFSFEGRTYFLGFTLLRYGEAWKIGDQVSPLAATDGSGAPQEITGEAFADLVAGD